MPEFITIDRGDLICICGNDACNEGFGMSDADGRVFDTGDDPDSAVGDETHLWDGVHYRCHRCGRVIDQTTGRVVKHAPHTTEA